MLLQGGSFSSGITKGVLLVKSKCHTKIVLLSLALAHLLTPPRDLWEVIIILMNLYFQALCKH